MSNIITREATAHDLPQLLEIYNHVIANTTAVYSYDPHTLEMRKTWFEDRKKNNFPVFVTEEDGVINGFASYGSFRAWPAYRYTIENSVYVHHEHRGKGIAKILLALLINDAKAKKYHAMIAGIDSTNEVSIKLHQQFGFVEVAHFKEVGYKFDKWLDLKFLELILTENPKI